jgi:hypothetical protein
LIRLVLAFLTSWRALTRLTLLAQLTLTTLLIRMRLARLRLTRLTDSDPGLADIGPVCTVSAAWLTLATRLTLATQLILILLALADQLKLMRLTWTLVQLMPARLTLRLVQLTQRLSWILA